MRIGDQGSIRDVEWLANMVLTKKLLTYLHTYFVMTNNKYQQKKSATIHCM